MLFCNASNALDQELAGTELTSNPAGFTKSIHLPKFSNADSSTTIILTSSFVNRLRPCRSKCLTTPNRIDCPFSVYSASTRDTNDRRIDESR